MSDKLLGIDETLTAGINCVYEGYIRWQKFTAIATGTMNIFRLKDVFSSNTANVGIWADNSGSIGVCLNHADASGLTDGWNDITFPDTSITNGVDYWLGFFGSGGLTACGISGGGTIRYKSYVTYPQWEDNPAGTASYSCGLHVAAYGDISGGGGAPAGTGFMRTNSKFWS